MPRRKGSSTNSNLAKTKQKSGHHRGSQDDFEATKGIINRLSKKYLAAESTQPRRSPRNIKHHREIKGSDSDEHYQADNEISTTSSDSDSAVISRTPSSDQYDFETSEEFLKLRFSPEKPASKKKQVKKCGKQTSRPVYKYNPVGSTKRTAKSSLEEKPSKIRRVSTADKSMSSILKESEHTNIGKSNKRKSRVSFDSGVFMTPSPLVHSNVKDSPSSLHYSTPSNTKTNTKQITLKSCYSQDNLSPDLRLDDLLIGPPNLSPVKRVHADTSLGHGALVTTPMDVQYEEIPQVKKPVQSDDLMGSFSAHEISKTYKNKTGFPSAKKSKKAAKEKKRESVSKWDLVAAKKNEEFEEIENFEFSIE